MTTPKYHPAYDVSAWEEISGEDASLIIADGPSIAINAYQGVLTIKDGPAGSPRTRRWSKIEARPIHHLNILNAHGYLSLEAMKWLAEAGITWDVSDRYNDLTRNLAHSGAYQDPSLVRAQAFLTTGAPHEATGVAIARGFIKAKLEGQAWNAEHCLGHLSVAEYIRGLIPELEQAPNVAAIGGWEGKGAAAYWSAWQDYPVRWLKPAPLQAHWMKYPGRKSLARMSDRNRGASDPVNAMLNYGYAVAGTVCVHALQGQYLSADMGLMHVDRKKRQSFALDLVEVMRPAVDEIVWNVLQRPLTKKVFPEDMAGVVRISAPLTHEIATQIRKRAWLANQHVSTVLTALQSLA